MRSVIYQLRCLWAENIFGWAMKMAPKDYVPSWVEVVVIAQDVSYRILADAAYRTDIEFRQAVAKASAEELLALASTPAICGTGNPEGGDYASLIEAVERSK